MRTRISKPLPLAVFFLLLLGALPATRAQADSERSGSKILQAWWEQLQEADALLQQGEWKKARKQADGVISDMNARLAKSDQTNFLLGTASYIRALAKAGLGSTREARWDYDVALHLRSELGKADLDAYGSAGEVLTAWAGESEESKKKAIPIAQLAANQPRESGLDHDVTKPKKKKAPAPQLPQAMRAECVEGVVIVWTIIDKEGYPTQPSVLASPNALLAFAALESIGQWRFEPGRLEGEPVDVHYNLTVNFRQERCRR